MPPVAGGRAGLEVISAGQGALPLISCSSQGRGPCTLAGQHNIAGSGGVGVDEPKGMRARELPHPLLLSG